MLPLSIVIIGVGDADFTNMVRNIMILTAGHNLLVTMYL